MTLIYLDDDLDDIGFFKLAAQPVVGIKQVLTTTDPLEFFNLLDSHSKEPITVFLDINMPYSGLQVLKEIRKRRVYAHIPVIMHSTSSDSTSIVLSKDLGASHYSIKPDSIRNLRKIIEQAIAALSNPQNKSGFILSY